MGGDRIEIDQAGGVGPCCRRRRTHTLALHSKLSCRPVDGLDPGPDTQKQKQGQTKGLPYIFIFIVIVIVIIITTTTIYIHFLVATLTVQS
jgi:hypothetical protein